MAKAGISLPSLMKLMGHTDIQTTMQYVNLSAEDVRDEFNNAINKLNNQGLLDEQQKLF
jgi:site-specific recombinase XerD